jgi:hypothetical protein
LVHLLEPRTDALAWSHRRGALILTRPNRGNPNPFESDYASGLLRTAFQ